MMNNHLSFLRALLCGLLIVESTLPGLTYGKPSQRHISTYSPPHSSHKLRKKDTRLLAQLLYGEARGESQQVKRAIADSVLNRTGKRKWWGNTLDDVILKPYQYSCFNKNDPNHKKVKNPLKYDSPVVWHECLDIARETLRSDNIDDSCGATHYYDDSINPPSWTISRKPVLTLPTLRGGTISFYRLDK